MYNWTSPQTEIIKLMLRLLWICFIIMKICHRIDIFTTKLLIFSRVCKTKFGLWTLYYVKRCSQFLQIKKKKIFTCNDFFPKKFSFKHNQHFINQNSTMFKIKICRTEVLLSSIRCSIFSGFYWQLCPLSDNRKSAMTKQVQGIWLWLCLLWMWSRLIELQPLHTTGR